ncbi:MAG: enoyl-CoA hydratase/isomerase family protein [Sphingomonadaceae bacterium]|nr:enoyl-CoA hydratase/isomerase family protein [Sphingomonadaceae bacterium]
MKPDTNKVLIDTDGPVAVITLNEPDALNAMGVALVAELVAAVKFVSDPSNGFRCLMITGAGRGFCSGASVAMIGNEDGSESAADIDMLGPHLLHVMKQIKDLPFPVVTAVNGPAAGFGFAFALAGDMVVAARSAFFLSAYRRIGISPDGGLSWMLPRIVGLARAKELMIMGTRLPAETALDWGLANRVFDDETFRQDAMALAQELANGPTVALGVTRQLFWESLSRSYEEQVDQEMKLQPITLVTDDATEGGRAMLEKRSAQFKGR